MTDIAYQTKVNNVKLWTKSGNVAGTIKNKGTLLSLSGITRRIKDEFIAHEISSSNYFGLYVEIKYLVVYVPPDDDPIEPQPKPIPISLPTNVFIEGSGDQICRMRMDNTLNSWGYGPRTLTSGKIKINPTGQYTPVRPPHKTKYDVDEKSGVTVQIINKRKDWEKYITLLNTPTIWDKITVPGGGYFDGAGGANPMKVLLSGGQAVNRRYVDGKWSFIQAQDFREHPDSHINYFNSLTIHKQTLVGHRSDKSMYVRVKKGTIGGWGDVYVPMVTKQDYPWIAKEPLLAIQNEYLEELPSLPFKCKISGYEATVYTYANSGSDIYGFVGSGELDQGWYLLDTMLITGDPNDWAIGGTWDDRKVFVSPWIATPGCPIIGWQRGRILQLLQSILRNYVKG